MGGTGGQYLFTAAVPMNAMLPHLRSSERENRSVLRAAWVEPARRPSVPGLPRFVSFNGGLKTLPRAIQQHLTRTRVLTHTVVQSITRRGHHFELQIDSANRVTADAIILAAPAHAAALMLAQLSADVADVLSQVRYASLALGAPALPTSADEALPTGGGFLVAPGEALPFAACSFSSRKWPFCAPDGEVVVRCHVQAERQPEVFTMRFHLDTGFRSGK